MTQPSQPIPAGDQPPEPSKKPIDASGSTVPSAPVDASTAPASCPGCGQAHGEGSSCPSCHATQSEPNLEETGPESGSGDPLVCVRYGRMSALGLFRSKIGPVERGLRVVIKSDRGLEIGTALRSATRQLSYEGRPLKMVGTIRRLATHEDLSEEKHLHQSEDRERKFCEEKMRERKLPMKLVAAEHLLGGDRIIFYFLSETRIDFRDLVRDLSHEYQTRIEMRQVGVRDEARLLADYERCGQFICCRAFIKEFQPVSMRMAKIQKATLDPSKISGRCGRLMCCLRYEQDTYDELRKNLPRKNSYVMTEHGPGRVVGGDILTQLVRLEIAGKYEVAPLDAITARDLKEADVMAAWSKLTTGPAGPRWRSSDTRGRDSGRRPEQPARPQPEAAPAAQIETAVAEATVAEPEVAETIEPDVTAAPVSAADNDRAPATAPTAPGAVPPGGVPPQGGVRKRRRRRRGGRDRRGPDGSSDNRQTRPPGQTPQAAVTGGRPQTNPSPAPAAEVVAAPRGPQTVSPPRTGHDDLGLPRAVLESFGAFDEGSAPPDDDGPDEGEVAGETAVSPVLQPSPGPGLRRRRREPRASAIIAAVVAADVAVVVQVSRDSPDGVRRRASLVRRQLGLPPEKVYDWKFAMSTPDETKANAPTAEDRLRDLLLRQPRYPREAYEFVNEALAYTVRLQKRAGHVSGQELCEGVRQFAVERFGYLARTVLESWNIRRTDDIGAIVYAMIEVELLRNENDSLADFHDVFDFEEAFDRSFRISLAKP